MPIKSFAVGFSVRCLAGRGVAAEPPPLGENANTDAKGRGRTPAHEKRPAPATDRPAPVAKRVAVGNHNKRVGREAAASEDSRRRNAGTAEEKSDIGDCALI